MDAQTFGAFIAKCRKEQKMTQAELAKKLQVTDKAVSRWERGIGFPDITTLEPLADALGVSILELMKSEKMTDSEISSREAVEAVSSTLSYAAQQRSQERKEVAKNLLRTGAIVLLILFLDGLNWQADAVFLTGAGVVLPIFCLTAFVVLLLNGIYRKLTHRPAGQTFLFAFALLAIPILLFALFFLAGALGIGPVAS